MTQRQNKHSHACDVIGIRAQGPNVLVGEGRSCLRWRDDCDRLLVTASVVTSSLILVTLMKEAQSSSEMMVLTRTARSNIAEDAILHSHRRENLKSFIALTGWTL
jgi:hypothetical protein